MRNLAFLMRFASGAMPATSWPARTRAAVPGALLSAQLPDRDGSRRSSDDRSRNRRWFHSDVATVDAADHATARKGLRHDDTPVAGA